MYKPTVCVLWYTVANILTQSQPQADELDKTGKKISTKGAEERGSGEILVMTSTSQSDPTSLHPRTLMR